MSLHNYPTTVEKEVCIILNKLEIYRCNICSKVYNISFEDFQKHILIHVKSAFVKLTKEKIYRCKSCSAGFLNRDDFNLHRLDHITDRVRKRHIQKANDYKHYGTSNIIRNFKCSECGRMFAQETTLKEHSKIHEPFPYICFCGIGYYREEDFMGHQNIVHNNTPTPSINNNIVKPQSKVIYKEDSEEEFYKDYKNNFYEENNEPKTRKKGKSKGKTCKVKKKKSKILKTNKIHYDDYVECPLCNVRLKKKYLDNHLLTHSDIKQFKCNVCSKAFRQSAGLYNHMFIHESRVTYKCGYCKKAFKFKAAMKLHERVHTGYKPYTCKFCNKPFSDPSAIKRHERIHTKDYRYFCDICNKGFTDKSGLLGHILRHDKRKMKCEICDKTFFTKHDLDNHISLHAGRKPFECHDCGKKFTLKQYLVIHIVGTHLGRKRIINQSKKKSMKKVKQSKVRIKYSY